MPIERSAEWYRGEKAALRRLKPEVWGQGLKAYSTRDLRQLVDGDYFKAEKNLAAAEAREATQPTAAEVVEAVEKALKRVGGLDYMGDPDVAIQSFPNLKVTPMQAAEELYELRSVIARWKEANGGK